MPIIRIIHGDGEIEDSYVREVPLEIRVPLAPPLVPWREWDRAPCEVFEPRVITLKRDRALSVSAGMPVFV
jgi:hypothetical protein